MDRRMPFAHQGDGCIAEMHDNRRIGPTLCAISGLFCAYSRVMVRVWMVMHMAVGSACRAQAKVVIAPVGVRIVHRICTLDLLLGMDALSYPRDEADWGLC